ncbi:MAG: VOC family protein [Victivallaceae bacterium]|nr:VOC family protein [Victivallaceae bacterium]
MKFRMIHNNFNVLDLDRSLRFYAEAFDLHEVRRISPEDGSFIIVYLSDDVGTHLLELTWLRDRTTPYDLGDDEFHLAFEVDDFEAAHRLHEKMGCICYENPEMGIYFCEDPDHYWLEVVPLKRHQ